jgi:hypothetical protein
LTQGRRRRGFSCRDVTAPKFESAAIVDPALAREALASRLAVMAVMGAPARENPLYSSVPMK